MDDNVIYSINKRNTLQRKPRKETRRVQIHGTG